MRADDVPGSADQAGRRPANRPAATLRTARLRLRPPRAADAADLAAAADDPRVARHLLAMPHPFAAADAAAWIRRAERGWAAGTSASFVLLLDGAVIGACALRRFPAHACAELSFWLGPAWWGRKLAQEAVDAVLRWGFAALRLHRVFGQHLAGNPASGRVMEAVGLRPEGVRRQHVRKGRRWFDVHQYGVLRGELPPRRRPAAAASPTRASATRIATPGPAGPPPRRPRPVPPRGTRLAAGRRSASRRP